VLVIYHVSCFHRIWQDRTVVYLLILLAHSYVYTFEPNPKWSKFYASSKEIQEYLEGVSDKYSAGRFVKLKHEVNGLNWDAASLKW
jgi:cation diffusion facilitator CzcD-associated flavoprotein CzcO